MNRKKLVQNVKKKTAKPGVAILLFVVVLGLGTIQYATDDSYNPLDNNQSPNNESVNESVLNQSQYYDSEDKVCRSPEINDTNISQLKQCVANQTNS